MIFRREYRSPKIRKRKLRIKSIDEDISLHNQGVREMRQRKINRRKTNE